MGFHEKINFDALNKCRICGNKCDIITKKKDYPDDKKEYCCLCVPSKYINLPIGEWLCIECAKRQIKLKKAFEKKEKREIKWIKNYNKMVRKYK